MGITRSSHETSQTKPHAKPFKELISRLGQPSQPAAPGYEDSTKRMIVHTWKRWTKYISPYMHRPRPPLRAPANKALLGIVRKSTTSLTFFSTPDPVKVCKNHLNCEVVRTFLEWSGDTSRWTKASSLFTYAKAWRMGVIQYTRFPVDPAIKMDMKNVREQVLILSLSSYLLFAP
jgi:hypothetical protein